MSLFFIIESEGCSDTDPTARLSPTLRMKTSSFATKMTMAQEPALLWGWSGDGHTSCRKSSSVLKEPFLMASGML